MSGAPAIDEAVMGRGLVPAFQPIVSLDGGSTVGFEALARWTHLDGIGPVEVFAHAATMGEREGLDHRCVSASIGAALDAGVPRDALVSVNLEPDTVYPGAIDGELLARARDELTLVFELTERSLLTHPQTLLSTVSALRSDGFMIALDDVGAHPDSLALLDVLAPDVIKLDMGLVQQQPKARQAQTISAVTAHHERTATPILAEGIEDDDHLEHALALGASLGQGYLYGRPGPIDAIPKLLDGWKPPAARAQRSEVSVPFDFAEESSITRRVGRKQILTALSAHIESQALNTADPPMLLTALQHNHYVTPELCDRYAELAEKCPLVAVFGEGLPTSLGDGVRGVPLSPRDPLCAEWTVVALGPQLAVALIARERPDDHPTSELDRRFEFVFTHDRGLVIDAAHSLLERMR